MRDQNDRDTDLDHGVVTETEKKAQEATPLQGLVT
jgi:hypothetical protein